jgi:hypothetical protein
MPDYNKTQYNPAAPAARVTLRNPEGNRELSDYELLIDTGADATVLPQAVLTPLGVLPVSGVKYELSAFDGTQSFASVADLDLIFLGRRFRGRYLVTDASLGVLGRDIINHLKLIFDGPGQQWSEA